MPTNLKPISAKVQSILDESRNGVNSYFKHFSRAFTFTDGVEELANAAGAFWLVDLIASYQHVCKKDENLQDFQIWLLRTDVAAGTADAYCFADSTNGGFDLSKAAIHQHIEYTDFPVKEVTFYVEQGGPDGKPVLMLPSER